MKVKIIKTPTNSILWYNNKFGAVFEVLDIDHLHWEVNGGEFDGVYIFKEDAEVVEDAVELQKIKQLKKIYIAHPLTTHGTIEDNYKKIDVICKNLLISNPDIVPISPLHAFSFYDPTGDQKTVINMCKSLLSSCDELWLHGEWKYSKGCLEELVYATECGIPCRVVE